MIKHFLFVLAIILGGCSESKSHHECMRKSVGTYLFSYERSEVDSKDSILLTDLTLALNDDGSFLLSKKIPYLNDSAGKWKVISPWTVEGRAVTIHTTLYFNNSKELDMSCCYNKEVTIYGTPFSWSDTISNFSKFGFLSFVK